MATCVFIFLMPIPDFCSDKPVGSSSYYIEKLDFCLSVSVNPKVSGFINRWHNMKKDVFGQLLACSTSPLVTVLIAHCWLLVKGWTAWTLSFIKPSCLAVKKIKAIIHFCQNAILRTASHLECALPRSGVSYSFCQGAT